MVGEGMGGSGAYILYVCNFFLSLSILAIYYSLFSKTKLVIFLWQRARARASRSPPSVETRINFVILQYICVYNRPDRMSYSFRERERASH